MYHVEVAQVDSDDKAIVFRALLDLYGGPALDLSIFMQCADPQTLLSE